MEVLVVAVCATSPSVHLVGREKSPGSGGLEWPSTWGWGWGAGGFSGCLRKGSGDQRTRRNFDLSRGRCAVAPPLAVWPGRPDQEPAGRRRVLKDRGGAPPVLLVIRPPILPPYTVAEITPRNASPYLNPPPRSGSLPPIGTDIGIPWPPRRHRPFKR